LFLITWKEILVRLIETRAIPLIAAFLYLSGAGSAIALAQQAKKPFTVADEIGLAYFGDPYISSFPEEAVRVSPDGNSFAVDTVRGRLDLNSVDDSLRFFRSADIEHFLEDSEESKPPSPVWIVNRSGKEGPIINSDWRWLADSSGVAFLERTSGGNQRLVLADLRKKTIEPLTSATETVKDFDIRDRQHYVYTAIDLVERKKMEDELQAPAIVGTGRRLYELVLPDDPTAVRLSSPGSILWAVAGAERFEVKHNGAPIVPKGSLALSPNGDSLVTILPVTEVLSSWETLYPPPYPSDRLRIQAGKSVSQYVRINLQTGSVRSLTEAPLSRDTGWWGGGSPSWSSDGQEILLPGTFLSSKDNIPSRPCIAIVDLSSNTRACMWKMKGHTGPDANEVEEGYYQVYGARFAGKDKDRVTVMFQDHQNGSYRSIEHQRTADGTWQVARQSKTVSAAGHDGLEVAVKQGLNEPPQLVATNKQTSRVIWDPNPQLNNFELGEASVYTWKDKTGRDWEGGLYKPSNYKPGQRYPLVIQTHGFMKTLFFPSGIFPTAFAARALAAAGVMVLQVGEFCPLGNPDEGPCAVSLYEAAANQLVSEALVDPERIGIIGFSRTCFYVMETLTTSPLRLKAASITDGVMGGYLEYMIFDNLGKEYDSMIGARPFGEGLQQWLKRSPGFNLDKVTAPMLVVGEGPISVLGMWQAYAGLRYLRKPVDLIMLNTDEHVLTNPAVRLASQGGSVDWFRFWLQGYEDPDPAKAKQYNRWRELRKMQAENERNSPAPQSASN
jgi:dipeptidyl aminopeptidase/acylaminoacyl peptidase